MFRKLLLISLIAVFLNACGNTAQNQTAQNENSVSASGGNTTISTPSVNTASINVNENTNTNTAKTVDYSPKRISFGKGANWGAVNITLAPGASQKFVVGAKSGQTMSVETSSKETSINLIKGKAETTEDFGFLNAELQSNGDYIFEVRNSTKKEVKTSVKVTIEDETLQRGNLNDVDEENERKNQNK